MLYYENKLKRQGFDFIVGVDEAGRGPLAGPVVAAAACLTSLNFENRIDDSKKLSPRQREDAYLEIIRKSIFGIGIVSEKIIDEVNILVSTRIAMENAILLLIDKIKERSNARIHILVDGIMKLESKYPYTAIIRGDSRSKSIAAASILAKVTRDRIMCIYNNVYPQYGFLRHKGYPTKMHKEAIRRFGPSLIHRTTFCCV